MSIQTELLAIQKATQDNILRTQDVVEWARENPDSALHKSIEWDDRHAADEYRLWQVRRLIALHIVREDGKPLVVSLSIDRKEAGGYRAIEDVLGKADLRDIMLQDALNDLERIKRKYTMVTELAEVWRAVEIAKQKRGGRRAA